MAPQREWFEKDYYAELGVSPDATEKDITRAYRKLAKQYHPDANPGDQAAEDRFKEISAAHDVLGDAEKRKEYDQVREMVASGRRPGRPRRVRWFRRRRSRWASATCGSRTSATWAARALRQPVRRTRRSARPRRGPGRSPARQRHRDRAPPRLPRRGARHHHLGEHHVGGAVPRVQRHRRQARHLPRALSHVQRRGFGRRRPGTVLVLRGLPHLRWPRQRGQGQVQELQGPRHRGAPAHGEGAHPRRASTTASASG